MPPIPRPERCPQCGSEDVRRSGVRLSSPSARGAAARALGAGGTTAWRWVCGGCGARLGVAPPPSPAA